MHTQLIEKQPITYVISTFYQTVLLCMKDTITMEQSYNQVKKIIESSVSWLGTPIKSGEILKLLYVIRLPK